MRAKKSPGIKIAEICLVEILSHSPQWTGKSWGFFILSAVQAPMGSVLSLLSRDALRHSLLRIHFAHLHDLRKEKCILLSFL